VPPRGAGLERLRLPPRRRLRRKSDYEVTYARGRRLGDGFFAIVACPNDAGGARLGLAVARKATGDAVQRNRVRRVIRETFRLRQHDLPSVDIVVSARAGIRKARNAELRASLNTLWDRVKDQCASLPRS